ncbi:hypothetical protein BLNAU_2531 [Blattamonas nauphoetae]|uniref:Uncharacterized protein n=1 Tax=Blattamonas nauphoetae TaxID=2049346 RepID=A0ABQ9YG05_9EUKA|nr:hypothetical protein BLNAU_2531 [Blattamonas nauphoetae]
MNEAFPFPLTKESLDGSDRGEQSHTVNYAATFPLNTVYVDKTSFHNVERCPCSVLLDGRKTTPTEIESSLLLEFYANITKDFCIKHSAE